MNSNKKKIKAVRLSSNGDLERFVFLFKEGCVDSCYHDILSSNKEDIGDPTELFDVVEGQEKWDEICGEKGGWCIDDD